MIALTGRQAGKTQAAAWALAHVAVFELGTLSVVACPSQRQSAEAVRRVKAALAKAGMKLKGDNVFGVETLAGARIIALPGDESTSRGLSVDGIVVADEAARLSAEMMSALRPMRARFAETARLMMLSTAWSRSDPFWTVWESDDPSWIRIKSLADGNPRYSKAFLDAELANLGETTFRREYMGEPWAPASARSTGAFSTARRPGTSRRCRLEKRSCRRRRTCAAWEIRFATWLAQP